MEHHQESVFVPLLHRDAHGGKSRITNANCSARLGLPVDGKIPLFGTISRLADQKGVDIQLGALEEMLNTDIQFVQLGSGSPDYERGYRNLARDFPGRWRCNLAISKAFRTGSRRAAISF